MLVLVGMKTGAATVEDSMVPQKVKNRATLQPAIALLGIYPKDTDTVKRRGTRTPVFIAAMSTIAKLWKEPRCPSTDKWLKKMWYIHTMGYFSAIRKDKYLPFILTWTELEGIRLSEISQSEKENYHMVSLIMWNIRNSAEDHKGREGKLNGKSSEKKKTHERLWTPGNKLRVVERGVGGEMR